MKYTLLEKLHNEALNCLMLAQEAEEREKRLIRYAYHTDHWLYSEKSKEKDLHRADISCRAKKRLLSAYQKRILLIQKHS